MHTVTAPSTHARAGCIFVSVSVDLFTHVHRSRVMSHVTGSVQYQLLTALASECMSADTDDSDPLASVTTVSLDDLPSSSAVVLAAFRIASSSPERTVGRSTRSVR